MALPALLTTFVVLDDPQVSELCAVGARVTVIGLAVLAILALPGTAFVRSSARRRATHVSGPSEPPSAGELHSGSSVDRPRAEPASMVPPADEAPIAAPPDAPPPRHEEQRILLVDDEPFLTRVMSRQLEALGYCVVAETSARAAIERFRTDAVSFDLVISDQTMPGLTGVQLIAELRRLRPQLRAILSTGSAAEGLTRRRAAELGICEMLIKPIGMDEMAAAIERALRAEAGRGAPSRV